MKSFSQKYEIQSAGWPANFTKTGKYETTTYLIINHITRRI